MSTPQGKELTVSNSDGAETQSLVALRGKIWAVSALGICRKLLGWRELRLW